MKLSYKFAISIIGITMISLCVLGIFVSIYSTNIIKSRITHHLESVSELKQDQLDMYVASTILDLEGVASDKVLIDYMSTVNNNFLGNTTIFSEDKILEHLNNELVHSEFTVISILTIDGVVDMSTSPNEDGKIRSNENYFINGLKSSYVQNFYISTSTRKPTMTIATPIISDNGKVLGVLSADMRLNRISEMLSERSGLGNTGETIIINKNHLLVSESRFIEGIAFKKYIYASGLNECLLGSGGYKEYKDYRDVKIIGVLTWIPDREICLVTKIDRVEAYNSLDGLYFWLSIFASVLVIISIYLAYMLSTLFTKPINNLLEGTKQWSKGNFNHKMVVDSNDEIAVLCNAFNDASKELSNARELEKNYTSDLRNNLEEKTNEMKKNLEELEKSKKASLNIMDDLFETNSHLKDLDKAKSDFLNVASHELKTPLTAISAYLEILDDYRGQFNEQQLEGLDAIKRNSNQLKMLIGNILEVSRLDSGRFDLNVTEIDVDEKISLLINNLKILCANKHIELKYDCNGVKKIRTDAMRFEEILNNLIGNAIKFTDKGSITLKIEYGSGNEEGFVVFYVIDTGVGIPEDKLNNLFQKFYQVDATVSRKYGGTGLGLSITKRMIELQGGKITVNSIFGKGTTFRFTLPIDQLKKVVSDVSETAENVTADTTAVTADTTVVTADATAVTAKNMIANDKHTGKKDAKTRKNNSNSKKLNRSTLKNNKK